MIPEQCPVWPKIKEKWPAVDPKTIAISYYPDIYCARELAPDFEVHEEVHLKQQETVGVEKWWKDYLADKDFLLTQELAAYRAQGDFIRKKLRMDRNAKVERMRRIARDFSGDIYGRVISFGDALKVLVGE